MTELLTAAQMRAIEAAAIASGEVTGLELMERAGAGVVEAVFAEWPELRAGSFRAVVLCGPGGNGGDGFVVARLLKEWGWAVEVFLYGTPEGMPPDARVNYERWVAMGEVRGLSRDVDPDAKYDMVHGVDAVFDALFGIGLTREAPYFEQVDCVLHECFSHALWGGNGETATTRIVAIDQPSGMCADSGRVLTTDASGRDYSPNPYASYLSVTFHRGKVGHYLDRGPMLCTALRVVDIGLPSRRSPIWVEAEEQAKKRVRLVDGPSPFRVTGHSLNKEGPGHKFSHGHALILSGPPGHGGAARMTARGALRIGAGLVTLACPPEALTENAGRLDAIMLKTVAEGAGLAEILADTRITALCLGPGLGLDARAAELVRVALKWRDESRPTVGRGLPRQPRPTVLDADALTLISRDPTLFAALHPACVLTPHAGEFARLFPDIAAKLAVPCTRGPAYSKVDATREAAARAGCTVLYKGPDTVIASPDGTCAINSAHYDRAAPWLATAGSGDVLAGFIAGLLARGFAPQQAAETAAWLHVEAARSFGPGLIAEDLPEELRKVFRALGL